MRSNLIFKYNYLSNFRYTSLIFLSSFFAISICLLLIISDAPSLNENVIPFSFPNNRYRDVAFPHQGHSIVNGILVFLILSKGFSELPISILGKYTRPST